MAFFRLKLPDSSANIPRANKFKSFLFLSENIWQIITDEQTLQQVEGKFLKEKLCFSSVRLLRSLNHNLPSKTRQQEFGSFRNIVCRSNLVDSRKDVIHVNLSSRSILICRRKKFHSFDFIIMDRRKCALIVFFNFLCQKTRLNFSGLIKLSIQNGILTSDRIIVGVVSWTG